MNNLELRVIGSIETDNGFKIKINKEYVNALKGISDFKYIQVVYWFDKVDNRDLIIENKPYKKGPEELGVFATRTPFRPNPIGIETVYLQNVDLENGVLYIPYIDAFNNTPVLDIKPYIPSIDRVENPDMPEWCKNWPDCYEKSGEFNWEDVFNF
ncbi:MAG: tRNA (N6-threonylcarbamoyladenosine(37)-N6)-methyltransferase TrmO [Clostridia bacterium]|nr:tRNA (N6-threonylcarbamoyladenosine(37)-N6)-methyltransferase TrmO [Clostridia bacterium]